MLSVISGSELFDSLYTLSSYVNKVGVFPWLKILPTGRLTPTYFFTIYLFFFIFTFVCRSLFCACFSGTTHCISHSGSLWMWLCRFPRTTLSGPYSLSPAGSGNISLGYWEGGRGDHGGRRGGWVSNTPGKHLPLGHHFKSPPRSLYVGECPLPV